MGLAHFSIDLREEFRAGVVDGWLADHAAGLTPNPCVRCNGNVRLDAMLELAERLGASALATGHYARVLREADSEPLLRVALDEGKDQSYALAALSPASLARLRFPLGALTKPEVRELARARRPCGGAPARLPGSVLPGGHAPGRFSCAPRRPRPSAPGRYSTATGARSASTMACTPSRSASATASASAAARLAT